MLAVAAAFTALAAFVPMSRGLGAAFLLALAAYTALAFRRSARQTTARFTTRKSRSKRSTPPSRPAPRGPPACSCRCSSRWQAWRW